MPIASRHERRTSIIYFPSRDLPKSHLERWVVSATESPGELGEVAVAINVA